MRFGYGAPVATEGSMYPIPYADVHDVVELALLAEELGFESVWANDHVSTPHYVRRDFDTPPKYWDAFSYLAFVGARTSRVRLGMALLVLPFHHPVRVAKQVATLDHLSGGRLVVGVGLGGYVEEYRAMWPDRTPNRGVYLTESIEGLRLLMTEGRGSYRGRQVAFEDVESFPKPLQPHLPLLSGGNGAGSRMRAGVYCDGWLPACLTVGETDAGVKEIRMHADEVSRELGSDFEIAPQFVVAIGSTTKGARRRFEASRLYEHMKSLSGSTLKGLGGALSERNLVGSPEEITDRIGQYQDIGVSTVSALLFACDDVPETRESMQQFSETVMSRFASDA